MVTPNNPRKYVGTDQYVIPYVTRTRRPLTSDFRQPETGYNYPLGCIWQVGKDPTTGVQGELWSLSKIVANQGFWVQLATGGSPSTGPVLSISGNANTPVFPTAQGNVQLLGTVGQIVITEDTVNNRLIFSLTGAGTAIDSIGVDAATAPGTNPVAPNGAGLITVTGGQVAPGTIGSNVLRTNSLAANTFTVEIQQTSAVAALDTTKNGVAHFNSTYFTNSQGFISRVGGSITESFNVDANTAPGTDPVLPNASGQVAVTGAQVAAGTIGANVIRTASLAANSFTIQVQRSTAVGSTDSMNNGVSHFDSARFTVDANGFVSLNGTGVAQTITGQSGGALNPTAGNWNFFGLGETTTSGAVSTLSILSPRTAQFVVDPTLNLGTHQTITAALAAAVSGQTIFIRPGTYTENLTLKAGVNLCAYSCDALTPNVTIVGNCTFTAAGTVSMSGIRLQTNSSFLLSVTGSAASIVNLLDCYLNYSNSTGISFTSSSSSSRINLWNCQGNIGTTGIALYSHSSSGIINFLYCNIGNSGVATTQSSNSAGSVQYLYSFISSPVACSSTGVIVGIHSDISCLLLNATAITTAGTGTSQFESLSCSSGTASAISVGAGTTLLLWGSTTVSSSNTNAITGAGTLQTGPITYTGSSSLENVTTFAGYVFGTRGTWTPSISFNAGTTGITYTTQTGTYTIVGKIVYYSLKIVLSSKGSSTGTLFINGWPFTISISGADVYAVAPLGLWQGITLGAGYTQLALSLQSGTQMFIGASGSAVAVAALTDAAVTNTLNIQASGFYYLA